MMQTNFVDTENSIFTTMSPKQQKDTLGDMRLDEEVPAGNEDSDDNHEKNNQEIQRGPRFKHFGHDRRQK